MLHWPRHLACRRPRWPPAVVSEPPGGCWRGDAAGEGQVLRLTRCPWSLLGAPGEGESPKLCDTRPQRPLSPLPRGAVLGQSNTALLSLDPLSRLSGSGAHRLPLCPGLRSFAGVWCPWGAGGADGGGGGGWLMHNAGLCTKPAAELNSWRFEKLSACQTLVNCSAAVTRLPTVHPSCQLQPGGPCPAGAGGRVRTALGGAGRSPALGRALPSSIPVRVPAVPPAAAPLLPAGRWDGSRQHLRRRCRQSALLPAMLPQARFILAFLRLPNTIWSLCRHGRGDPAGRTCFPRHGCSSSCTHTWSVCGTVVLPARHRGSPGRTLLWRAVGSGAGLTPRPRCRASRTALPRQPAAPARALPWE